MHCAEVTPLMMLALQPLKPLVTSVPRQAWGVSNLRN